MWSAPNVGSVFFPLDEKLGLRGNSLSPSLTGKLVRLSSHLPFRQAANLLADFFGVVVSWETARRLCEEAGQLYCEHQRREVERIEREIPPVGPPASHLQVSVDGAMVALVGGEWAEVKTMAIGVVDAKLSESGEMVSQCSELSYFSRLAEAQQFGQQALVETQRRGLSESPRVSAVMDGAEWLQGFVDLHCPKAKRILDFPHAAQRLGGIGEALWGVGSGQAKSWLAAKLHQLKHTGSGDLIAELERLAQTRPDQPMVLVENLNYLKKRHSQLEYARFRADGHPIGSGIVESANKLVVQARLKGAGMHWQRANVNSMLALRNLECNGRWHEGWEQLAELKDQTRRVKRQARRRLAQPQPAPAEAGLAVAALAQHCSSKPAPKAAYGGKPAADHPWRRAKVGRARFELASAG